MQFFSQLKNKLVTFLYDRSGTFKFQLLTTNIFISGLIAKLYAATFFVSENFTENFVPFTHYFVTNGSSPYDYFYNLGNLTVFPYPQLMLYIMSIPGFIFSPFLSTDFLSIGRAEALVYHLPILLADIAILLVLSRWLQNKQIELLWLYWASPVLFYINYIHSQLDVIPIALTFISLHYLFKEQWRTSALWIGAAITTKIHIVVVLPFLLIYLLRRNVTRRVMAEVLVLCGTVFVVVNHFSLLSSTFYAIVLANPVQQKIFDLTLPLGSGVLYLVPAAFLLLVLHSMTFSRFNRDTFVMFLGFAFGILTLGIAPMPGWYYWIIPFLVYFYIKFERFSKVHFGLLSIAYFLYFATIPASDYSAVFSYSLPIIANTPTLYEMFRSLNLPANLIANMSLTILQTVLFINVIWLFGRGVADSKKRKLYNMPYLIGIAGDSGSGKSTLANLLTKIFGENNLSLVAGDAMHKWERGNEMWQKFTHLNPNANLLHEDIEHVKRLQNGDSTYRRHYDHDTGTFTAPEKLDSKNVVVFEGLHSLYLTYMQRALDLKIFISPEEQLRIHWKLCRDMRDRGYTKERVLSQLQAREADARAYINSQATYADIVFSLKSETDLAPILGNDVIIETYLEITCDNTIDVGRFINAIDRHISVEHHMTEQSHVLRISGGIDSEVFTSISYVLVPDLYNIVISEPEWENNYNGIMQLFIIFYIFESLKLHHNE